MPDPLLLEQRFRSLQETLRLTSSPRMRLVHLLEFGEQFHDAAFRGMFAGYAPELFQEFAKAGLAADFSCTHPGLLQRLLDYFLWSELELPDLVPLPEWGKVKDHLQHQLALVSQWARRREPAAVVPDDRSAAPGSVWVPFVELERTASSGEPSFACLRQLRVQIHSHAGGEPRDEVHFHPLSDDSGTAGESLQNALSAARATLKRLSGVEIRQPLLVHCTVGGTTPVTGHSLEAGLAASMVTALGRFAGHRREFALRRDVAVTGRITPGGDLLPVDDRGLAVKVEACTWSWISRLVVPLTQTERSRQLADVAASTGGVSLPPIDITGATHLEELFFDRRITLSHRVPAFRQMARVIWRNRMAATVTLLAAALVLVGRILYGPTDRNPAILTGSGAVLLVQNRTGEILDTLYVGEVTAAALARHERVAAVADVDGDGIQEVVWGQPTDDASVWEVRCSGIRGDGPVWTVPLRRHIEYPGQPVKSDGFGMRLLDVKDLDADGAQEVLLLGYHTFFPSLLLRLDAATGKETGCYVHAGHLIDMQFADLDADGIKEVLVCGISNAFREGVLAVLDPRHIDGAGPSTPAYAPADYSPGAERWYLRIPRTIVGAAVPLEHYGRAVRVAIDPQTRTFQLTVVDQSEDPAYPATITGLFGFDMHPISFDKGSDYDETAARLQREGRIPSVPGKEYFEKFRATLRYWNGFSWSQVPVLNGRYADTTAGKRGP